MIGYCVSIPFPLHRKHWLLFHQIGSFQAPDSLSSIPLVALLSAQLLIIVMARSIRSFLHNHFRYAFVCFVNRSEKLVVCIGGKNDTDIWKKKTGDFAKYSRTRLDYDLVRGGRFEGGRERGGHPLPRSSDQKSRSSLSS